MGTVRRRCPLAASPACPCKLECSCMISAWREELPILVSLLPLRLLHLLSALWLHRPGWLAASGDVLPPRETPAAAAAGADAVLQSGPAGAANCSGRMITYLALSCKQPMFTNQRNRIKSRHTGGGQEVHTESSVGCLQGHGRADTRPHAETAAAAAAGGPGGASKVLRKSSARCSSERARERLHPFSDAISSTTCRAGRGAGSAKERGRGQ